MMYFAFRLTEEVRISPPTVEVRISPHDATNVIILEYSLSTQGNINTSNQVSIISNFYNAHFMKY